MKSLDDIRLFEKFAGLAGYWIFTDSGPYEYVADFQARLFHWKHYPIISGLSALIVSLIPALIIIYLLSIIFSKKEKNK